jgi:hypothetical protein
MLSPETRIRREPVSRLSFDIDRASARSGFLMRGSLSPAQDSQPDHVPPQGRPQERADRVHPRGATARAGRDEKLWQALRFPTIEEYAAKRLQLQRSALYHYLQIHDWLRRFHPAWLAQRPQGFIPISPKRRR